MKLGVESSYKKIKTKLFKYFLFSKYPKGRGMAKYPSPLVSGSPNYGVGEQAMNIKVLIQAYQTTKLTSKPTQQGGFINKLGLNLSRKEENENTLLYRL